jgi:hypothetical protein
MRIIGPTSKASVTFFYFLSTLLILSALNLYSLEGWPLSMQDDRSTKEKQTKILPLVGLEFPIQSTEASKN